MRVHMDVIEKLQTILLRILAQTRINLQQANNWHIFSYAQAKSTGIEKFWRFNVGIPTGQCKKNGSKIEAFTSEITSKFGYVVP